MKPYTYQPLNDDEIRLFEMDPSASQKARITGTLRIVTLQERSRRLSSYTTLSYAWGKTYSDRSHLSESVVCDGFRLDVTSNLKQALLRIRQLNRVQKKPDPLLMRLWIDAMCINQEDPNERSRQVRIMASIYYESSLLLVWLGEFDRGNLGDHQAEMLSRFCTQGENLRSVEGDGVRPHWVHQRLLGLGNEIKKRDHHSSVSEWHVLDSILTRPWFFRRWVIQECEMAPRERTHLLMGNAAVHRKNFEALLESFACLHRAVPLNTSKQKLEALRACHHYEASECSDPRDLIYAILHLCSDGDKIEVDYTRDVRLTYLEFVKRSVLDLPEKVASERPCASEARTKVLSVPDSKFVCMLLLALARNDPGTNSLLERWVPDWRVKPAFKSRSHVKVLKRCMDWDERTDTDQISWAIQVSRDGYHYLRLKGTLVDKIPYDNIGPLSKQLTVPVQARPYLVVLSELRLECSTAIQPGDRIWLAYSKAYKTERGFLIAFLLRMSDKISLLDQLPVYRMQDCIVLYDYGPASYMDIRQRLLWMRGWEPSLKRDLALCGLLVDQEFCLE